jgi:UDP-N-acetylglucosamine/UDP-N-acetylgalactosamine diphosphorylase
MDPRTTADLPRDLVARIAAAGQEHVLTGWDSLDDSARAGLAGQLQSLDWDGFATLRGLVRDRHAAADTPAAPCDLGQAATPPCLRLRDPSNAIPPAAATDRGAAALASGRVGGILVAGGQGSRLGFAGPKGMFPIGPVSQASLFEFLLGNLVAVRHRFGAAVPLAIMTSSATDAPTRRFLADHAFFGLDPDEVLFFSQHDMPALDDTSGDLLLEAPGRLALAPDGHGGMLLALAEAGGLEWFARQGVEHVVSFQVDNPLAMPLDREFLGYHLLTAADFTPQVVRKIDPAERVGVVVEVDGACRIVEYSDLPPRFAGERLPDGRLRFHAGSIAVHAFARSFLERCAARPDALPLHVAHKAVPFIDAAGNRVAPTTPNAIKFERFIFDLMPLATTVTLVEIDAAEGFAPLKNAAGAAGDTAAHVQAALVARARRLLARAGIDAPADVPVELAADRIIDEVDLRGLLPPGTTIDRPLVVGR